MNIDRKHAAGLALEIEREFLASGLPQPVRKAICLKRHESLEEKEGLDHAAAGRIALGDGHDIGTEDVAKARLVGQHFPEGLMQETSIDGRLKPVRHGVA